MSVTQDNSTSTRSGGPCFYEATARAAKRLVGPRHRWISDVHTPPQPGRHRAPEPVKQRREPISARLSRLIPRRVS